MSAPRRNLGLATIDMSKKIKCKNCSGEFLQTAANTPANCPACGTAIAPPATATARAAFVAGQPVSVPDGDAPQVDWQWMPPGYQEPVCFVNGEPRQLKFTASAKHAELFDLQLQHLLARARSGAGDKPFTDYDHQDAAASSRPVKIYWAGDDPRTGGIRLVTKPTAKAREAIRDGEWDRFSPSWDFDPDTEEPIAISTNLGGLVNKAAFKTIAPVVAKNAGAANQQQQDTMDKNEIASAVAEGMKPFETRIAALEANAKAPATPTAAATAQAAAADEKLTQIITGALKPLTDKVAAFETAQATALTAQAKAAVQKHVDRGAIAPEEKMPDGTLAVEFWQGQFKANAANAEFAMGKLAGKSLTLIIRGAGGSATATAADASFSEPENRAFAKMKELRKDNKAYASDADAMQAWLRTPEGNAAYADILAGRSSKRLDVKS
jgi:hypothetical protein